MNDSQSKTAGSEVEREAFEAFVRTQPGGTDHALNRRDMDGSERADQYVNSAVNFGWKAWQARATLSHPATQAGALQAVSGKQIAELKHRHGITSDGRGIKELEQVVAFAHDVLSLAATQPNAAPAVEPPSLKDRAIALMEAGHAFWKACRADAGGGAVRWLKATDGTTIIFTRGEYARTLLSAIGSDYQAPETVFEQPVDDDDMGGIVACRAAPAAEVVADEQLAAMVKAAGGDVVEHGASGDIRGDYEFHMDADTLRKLLAAPGAAVDAREQETLSAIAAEFREAIPTRDGAVLAAMIEEGVTVLGSHIRYALASRSEAPEARPNAAGQEQGTESLPSTCYSLDEENFTYDDLYEVLAALDDQDALVEGAVFYEGTSTHPKPSAFFCVEPLFEGMGERASDECGEWAEDFPDVSVEKKRELEAIIKAWIEENVSLTFWIVSDARRVEVTAEMLAEHRAITATPPLEAVGSSGMTADKEGA